MTRKRGGKSGSGDESSVNGFRREDWRDLLLEVDGKPRERSAQNALVFFRNHPEVAPSLAFNTFSRQAMALAALPWDMRGVGYPRPLNEDDGIQSLGWLERQALYKLSVGTARQALVAAARHRPYNPLVTWLQGLEWDGKHRISNWLTYYLGVPETPYTGLVSSRFLLSAVSRALKPGGKMDTMPILEGAQGIKKSTAMRVLFGPDYYSDELADFGSKDAALQMQGRWCIEVAELSTFGRSDIRRVKEVLSRQIDRFRAPYDAAVSEHPRQCILVGTTNPIDGYFKDPTGGRRFWPIKCGSIDIDALSHDRDQLWAEAVKSFEEGAKWWLVEDEIGLAKTEQDERQESDPWDDLIANHIVGRNEITVGEILTGPLKIDIARQTKNEQMRVASILVHLGWARKTVKRGSASKKVWMHTDELPPRENSDVVTDGGNLQDIELPV